jgi:2-dehydropantoate 2-reductase
VTEAGATGPTRVGVIGAGALGTLVAGLLAERPGVEVWLVSRRPDLVDHVDAHGVVVHDETVAEGRTWRSRPGALVADEVACREAGTGLDVALLLTQAADTGWAIEVAGRLVRPDGLVVSLQNGLAPADLVEAWGLGGVAGTTYQAATARGPGEVAWTMRGPTTLAPRPAARDAAVELASRLGSDDLPVAVADDGQRDGVLWAKLVGALTNAVSGALLVPVHDVLASEAAMAVVGRAQAELLAVARARGIEVVPPTFARPPVGTGEPATPGPRPVGSAYQALVAGRADEVGDTLGDLRAAADQVGVPTPVCDALALLVEARRQLR